MVWSDAQALHIFAPAREPYGANWVEQLLGEIVKPLAAIYQDAITWIWVTRYSDAYTDSKPPRGYPLPAEFHADGRYRFIVLRLHASPERRAQVHASGIEMSRAAGCFPEPDGWIPYDPVHDLGGDRFVGNDAPPEIRNERARLVTTFVDSTIRLMLHSLSRHDDGSWRLEPNMLPKENPKGSFFESIRHLFFNATGVPTTVLLGGKWTTLQLATYWMPPILVGTETLGEFTIELPIHY